MRVVGPFREFSSVEIKSGDTGHPFGALFGIEARKPVGQGFRRESQSYRRA